MAKRPTKKATVKPEVGEKSPAPAVAQLTFTEKEVEDTVEYMNFVYNRATFKEMNSKEALEWGRLLRHMHAAVKKMEAHIFEFKRVIETRTK